LILYFLRHGWAGDPLHDSAADEARELTEAAEAELRAAAELWRRLQVRPDLVLSSPLPRARRTAELLIDGIVSEVAVTADDRLRPGATWGDLSAALADRPAVDAAMFVGHSPDLPNAVQLLTGGSRVALHVGGMACLEFDGQPGRGKAKLVWLLDPDLYLSEPHDDG
jgi:phosphohistidine phosphatase